MKQDDELHQLLDFRDQLFLIHDCRQSKLSILIILFLKFASVLQEGYSTLFWNQTSTLILSMLFLNIFLSNLILQRRFSKKSRNLSDSGNDHQNINCITIHSRLIRNINFTTLIFQINTSTKIFIIKFFIFA